MDSLTCRWLGLNLSSPLVLASLTLFSRVDIASHFLFFKKAVDLGAGCIVLPSVNPASPSGKENDYENDCIAQTQITNSGLGHNNAMGFSVLGPPSPNIASVAYGENLLKRLKDTLTGTPILGSIAKMGSPNSFICAAERLKSSGADGLELNFSCPNITQYIGIYEEYYEIIKGCRSIFNSGISLKISPGTDLVWIEKVIKSGLIDGVTVSNAHIGLIPPSINSLAEKKFSPFDKSLFWSPTGIYGPQERSLTFRYLYNISQIHFESRIDISCVGGIIDFEHAIQAIMLGASTIQLSSAIAWNGLLSFSKINQQIIDYLNKNGIKNICDLNGIALDYIKQSSDLVPFEKKYFMQVDQYKCKKCKKCSCVEKLCVAIRQENNESAMIKRELCSGCGWCFITCPFQAIEKIGF